jgi:hypothetical protein
MAQLRMINVSKLTPKVVQDLVANVRHAIQNHDFDQDWQPNPIPGSLTTITHRLKVQPKTVTIYASNDSAGAGYTQILPSYVDNQTIQFTTALAHVRVLANK